MDSLVRIHTLETDNKFLKEEIKSLNKIVKIQKKWIELAETFISDVKQKIKEKDGWKELI